MVMVDPSARLALSVGLAALIGCVLLGVVYQVPPRVRLQCDAWRGAPSLALRARHGSSRSQVCVSLLATGVQATRGSLQQRAALLQH
jgi:hypothetical protein